MTKSVKNNSTKSSGNANRGSQGTKIHNDKKKVSIKEIQYKAPVTNMYSAHKPRFSISGNVGETVTVKGCSLVSDVVAPIVAQQEMAVIDRFPISPFTIPSARLHALTNLYYNYIFKKIKINYRTRVGTLSAGQVGLYFFDDAGEILELSSSSGYLLESQILEAQGGVISPLYSNFSIDWKGKPFRPLYRCTGQSGSVEDLVQTNLAIAIATDLNAQLVGMLEIEYEIELSKPKSLPVVRDDVEKPHYTMKIGQGATDASSSSTTVVWTDDTTTAEDWLGCYGVYMMTFADAVDPSKDWSKWSYKPYTGATYYLKVELQANSGAGTYSYINFKLYSDYVGVITDTPVRSLAGWKTGTTRVNLHKIVSFSDRYLRTGAESLSTSDSQRMVVNSLNMNPNNQYFGGMANPQNRL